MKVEEEEPMINNKLKDYITYMLLIITIGLFITNYRSIRKELKHYKEELEELETERIRIMENIPSPLS